MSAAQVAGFVALVELATSLSAALACATVDSDPAAILRAAGNNAAASISMQLECAAEGC